MFNTTPGERPTNHRGNQVSILAADLVVTGVVASEGTIEVHGTVDGEIAAATINIGQSGQIKGKVQAGQLDVQGNVSGQVAVGTLTLRAASTLEADCQSNRLVIENGATVQGRFNRPGENKTPVLPEPVVTTEAAGPLDPKVDEAIEPAFEPKGA